MKNRTMEGQRDDERHDGEHEPTPTRRQVLDRALELGGIVWAAGVAIPAAVYLWPAGSTGPARKTIDVDISDMPKGSGRVVRGGSKPILVLRLPSGEFRALSAVCTHLGCIVHWAPKDGRIECPCHAGEFTPDGKVASGPPPRPLPVYPSRIASGRLRIQV